MNSPASSVIKPGSDQALQQAFQIRRERRLATSPEPQFPASGTELVAARLAEARALRTLPGGD